MGKKLDIEYIRAIFERNSCILETVEYINSWTTIEYICSNGHRCTTTWNSWQQGHRCPICAKKLRIEKLKKDFNIIKESFGNDQYTLVTTVDKYKNAKTKLGYICPNGHYHSITWNDWQQGKRCPICALKLKEHWKTLRKDFNIIRKSFEDANYILVTTEVEYKNSRQKLGYICPNGHYHSISWDNWRQGYRCPKCSNRVSKWEREIRKILDGVGMDYIANDRTQLINPKTNCALELDIWLPQLNKAIECNGLYWHSSEERVCVDQMKQQLCQQQGIDLLVITDEEWYKNLKNCKNKLKTFVRGV